MHMYKWPDWHSYIFFIVFHRVSRSFKIRVMDHTRVWNQRNTKIKWSYWSRAKFEPKYWGRIQETWGRTPKKGSLTKVSKFNALAFSDPKNEAKTPQKEQVLSFANINPNLHYTRVRNEPLFLHNNKCMPTGTRKVLGIVGQDSSYSKSNRLHVDIFRFCFHSFEVYFIDSSIIIGNSHKVSNFNRLFLCTQPIHMQLTVGSPRAMACTIVDSNIKTS